MLSKLFHAIRIRMMEITSQKTLRTLRKFSLKQNTHTHTHTHTHTNNKQTNKI